MEQEEVKGKQAISVTTALDGTRREGGRNKTGPQRMRGGTGVDQAGIAQHQTGTVRVFVFILEVTEGQ